LEEKIFISYQKTHVGELIIGTFGDSLCLCDWRFRKQREQIDERIKAKFKSEYFYQKSDLIIETKKQLDEYFSGKRKEFSLPILFAGTDFQKNVWSQLLTIPYGETRSYLELSKQLKNIQGIRAVASANGANALSIIVPCHRIIGNKGELVGYAGGIPAKKALLDLENPPKAEQLNLF
jgi:methylated-DNA-[protein]-cysteine S-methyltransferase